MLWILNNFQTSIWNKKKLEWRTRYGMLVYKKKSVCRSERQIHFSKMQLWTYRKFIKYLKIQMTKFATKKVLFIFLVGVLRISLYSADKVSLGWWQEVYGVQKSELYTFQHFHLIPICGNFYVIHILMKAFFIVIRTPRTPAVGQFANMTYFLCGPFCEFVFAVPLQAVNRFYPKIHL